MAWQDRGAIDMGQFRRTAPVAQRKKKSFWQDQISTGGGIGGAIAGGAAGAAAGSVIPVVGTAAGGILGALLGGAAGGGAGQVAENAVVGDELGKDVGREALLNGVFGAGPIRAGSLIARTGSNLVRGAGKSSLSQAGTKAITDRPIRNAVGKAFSGASDNMAVRAVGATPSQLTNFQKKFGEDITQTLKRNNLVGKNVEDVAAFRSTLDRQFGDLVQNAGPVSKKELASSLKAAYAPMLKSASLDNKAAGQAIKNQADEILKNFKGDEIPASALNSLKREFDSLVNYTQRAADPAKYGVNKKIADVLRETVQGAPGAKGLKETGMEISKLRQLEDILQAQGNRGRGSNPLGITDALGGVVGGSVGSIPGGMVGLAAAKAANSAPAKRGATKLLSGAGDRLAGQSTGNPLGVIPTSMRVGGANLVASDAQSPAGSELSAMTNNPTTTAMSNIDPMNSNMPQSYQNGQEMSIGGAPDMEQEAQEPSIGGFSKSQIENAMAMAALDGNEDAFGQLKDLYDMLPAGGGEFGDLSQSSRNALASSDNAINTVNQLEQLYTNAGGARGRLGGMLGNLAADAGLDSSANSYNSLADASVTQIAKALAGSGAGTVSDMDAKVIIQALPRLNDTPEEAATKFAALRARLENARQNTLLYGGGASEAPADQMTQQPYSY